MGSNDLTDDEIEALLHGNGTTSNQDTEDQTSLDLSGGGVGDPESKKKVQQVSFGDINESKNIQGNGSNLDLLMDVSLDVSVEIGRTQKSVQEVLSLNIGSVIELNKLSGEPVDLLVNGKMIAKAEVVIIDENFGIRITEIVKPQNRVTFN